MGLCVLRSMESPHNTPKTTALRDFGFRIKYEMPDHILLGVGKPERGVYPNFRTQTLAVYEMQIRELDGFTHPYRRPWDY